MAARDLLAALLDGGTYRSWDRAPVTSGPAPATPPSWPGRGPRPDLTSPFAPGRGCSADAGWRWRSASRFLGGSIGVAAAERLTLAVERATAERLPLIAAPASGGTRMQEGTVAFLPMATITAAVAAHQAAGLPYLVYLRHPTTGGVFASWASVGHLTVAEPGALIGFLGPACTRPSPAPRSPMACRRRRTSSPTAWSTPSSRPASCPLPDEGAYVHCATVSSRACPFSMPGSTPVAPCTTTAAASTPGTASHAAGNRVCSGERMAWRAPRGYWTSAWESVLITRRPDRPGAADLIRAAAADVVRLREGGLILALARIGGSPCVLAAQDRNALPHGEEMLRTAQRGMQLAADLGLPLVTVIDAPGGELSRAAEEEGIAREIARCLLTLIALPAPTVAVLLGQGTGGAALALLPANRVLGRPACLAVTARPRGRERDRLQGHRARTGTRRPPGHPLR